MENKKLLKKVHIRLTLICAAIITGVILAMSFLYLSILEKNLYDNQFLSFQNSADTLFFTMEQQVVISYSQLETTEKNQHFYIQIKDNGKDFLFNSRTQDGQLKDAFSTLQESFSPYSTQTAPFSHNGRNYFAAYKKLLKDKGFLEILVLFPLASLEHQIQTQKLTVFCIAAGASVILFFFAFYFTGRMLKPILQMQKEQEQFIAAASHELRTPLSVILSCSNAFGKASLEEQKTFLKSIETESLRMSRLITDLLTLFKTDYLTYRIEKEDCDPDALLLDSYDAFLVLAKEKNLSLTVTLPQEISPPCRLDKQRIMQVLAILIQNAISYTPDGGSIRLFVESRHGRLIYRVEDNGPGIPDTEKKEIFHKFYRADKARKNSEHFGLGLSIAREIINAHHGSLYVKDTPGGGSTFVAEIPME